MELEVAPPKFFFHSNCSSPSSNPHHPNFFFSAPTSPSSSLPTSPPPSVAVHDHDFEFDFSGHLHRTSLSADELFHGGKIRPLKPPPSPPSSSTISNSNKIIQDPKDSCSDSFVKNRVLETEQLNRRRSGRASSFSYSSDRKPSKPMPTFRIISDDDVISHQDMSQGKPAPSSSSSSTTTSGNTKSSYASFLSSLSFTKGYRKWRLKDFLLFRSASEGRAAGKDGLRKYSVLSKKTEAEVEVRNSSFRSTESFGSVSSRRRGPVSPHELHYTVNRAASEELKKKTVLPYKQLGPLGCLGFNPTLHRITS